MNNSRKIKWMETKNKNLTKKIAKKTQMNLKRAAKMRLKRSNLSLILKKQELE